MLFAPSLYTERFKYSDINDIIKHNRTAKSEQKWTQSQSNKEYRKHNRSETIKSHRNHKYKIKYKKLLKNYILW